MRGGLELEWLIHESNLVFLVNNQSIFKLQSSQTEVHLNIYLVGFI